MVPVAAAVGVGVEVAAEADVVDAVAGIRQPPLPTSLQAYCRAI